MKSIELDGKEQLKDYLDFLTKRDDFLHERYNGLTIAQVSSIVAKHSRSQVPTMVYIYLRELLISSREVQGIASSKSCILNITQEDIAHDLNITRQSVATQLKVLVKADLITTIDNAKIKLNA